MKKKTYISQMIELSDNRAKYDAEVKKILADKTILAWIIKYSTKEFRDYTIEELRNCIEGAPEISNIAVRPGCTPEAITGSQTEDKVPGEGEITYDIRFSIVTKDAEHVKIIINVEAQKNYYPGYDLVTRAIFYCARMLSAQLDTEFTPRNYNDIKKVYSIWICMQVPDYAAYTITRYKVIPQSEYGHVKKESRYDLLEAVMICLGKDEDVKKGNLLHGMLQTLLSEQLSPREKENILEEEYGIETTVEMEGGLQQMCTLSGLIEEKAIAKGIEQGIETGKLLSLLSLVSKGLLELEVAAAELGMSVERFKEEMEKGGF